MSQIILKPKIGCSNSINQRWPHSSLFDFQKVVFELVRYSIKWFDQVLEEGIYSHMNQANGMFMLKILKNVAVPFVKKYLQGK